MSRIATIRLCKGTNRTDDASDVTGKPFPLVRYPVRFQRLLGIAEEVSKSSDGRMV
jgi:hypothetical protein